MGSEQKPSDSELECLGTSMLEICTLWTETASHKYHQISVTKDFDVFFERLLRFNFLFLIVMWMITVYSILFLLNQMQKAWVSRLRCVKNVFF